MLEHVKTYSTFRFFEFYCLLFNRNCNKLKQIGYYPIFIVLNCIKYSEVYKLTITHYNVPASCVKIYEDDIEISCEAIVGIKVNYINDPVNTLMLAIKNKQIHKSPVTFTGAAVCGHLECLKYLFELGCVGDCFAIYWTASHGHLECLKYLCKYNRTVNLFGLLFECLGAIKGGKIECFKYLWTNYYCKINAGRVRHNIEADICTLCETAAENGEYECLKYLIDNGCLMSISRCVEKVKHVLALCGNIPNKQHQKCLEYLEGMK